MSGSSAVVAARGVHRRRRFDHGGPLAGRLYRCAPSVYNPNMDHRSFRAAFMRRIGDATPFQRLLDLIPDVSFFVKDRRGRFVMQNRRAYESCHVAAESETIGRTDHDFFPGERADLYVAGDRRVMETGHPLINAIEPSPDAPAGSEFIVCSKYPLRDRRGRIIGVACMYRRIDNVHVEPRHFSRISRAVDAIHRRFAEPLGGAQLARISGLSRGHFDRTFRRLFDATAHDYLTRVRIHAATALLAETRRPITAIALEVGFYDHSHFSRTFRRLLGIRPQDFRARRTLERRADPVPGRRRG
jgi:AraC-like DNA-binding protein